INDHHKKVAHKLISLHNEKPHFMKIPVYSFEEIRKGFICAFCSSMNIERKRSVLQCKNCENIEGIELAILRSVDEYTLLFPDRKITTRDIFEWCAGVISKNLIQRILIKNFNIKENAKATYYERKD
ncbi:NERD domain-containing protein, partial [Lederbergia panacisoli]|nr:NERD domain-containing protein [Lederbergia panacisoli]